MPTRRGDMDAPPISSFRRVASATFYGRSTRLMPQSLYCARLISTVISLSPWASLMSGDFSAAGRAERIAAH